MKKVFFFMLSLIFMGTCMGQIGSRMTTFNPALNSFKFSNTLEVEIINDIKMSGFCGGMVYTALDYFKSSLIMFFISKFYTYCIFRLIEK